MPLFRGKAEAKLIERGLDPARLPPGQYLTEKWPVLHAGSVPRVDLATWTFRVVVASRYFWKSAKWLRGLELLDHDQPGFWERYGYHNEADYRQEQRYSF